MREPVNDWRLTLKRRTAITAAVLAFWAAGIQARLVYLQVIDHGDLVERAERQQMRTIKTPAKRGDIVDRRGHVLATSVDADTIFAVPSAIGDEQAIVAQLCRALDNCTAKEAQDIVERLRKQRNFAYVRRQVSPEEARRVADLKLDGIGFVKESRRFYPNKELAAHLLGFVGLDNKGLGGLESTYDVQIRGKDGQILVQTDARRQAFGRSERPPTTGSSLELTIDEYLQHVAERELHAAVLENHAVGGSLIAMDPRTGEILAMANEPTFNPNVYRESIELNRRNRAVQDLYEPGSTFKVVTASAAIQENVMPVTAPIDVSGGQIRIGSRVVHDTHNYGTLSFTDVIVKSSNVGAIKIGFKLGAERLSEYVAKYGFGRSVSPDFPSENWGIVWNPAKWTDDGLASVSMGYQIGVTPLQMIAAVSTVANRGEYLQPRVVRALYKDDRRYAVKPKVVRQTVSADTAATLTSIMEQVVERGTATLARIPGFAIAGKTGTANKLINGRYSSETFASFVGFLPADNPRIAILVVMDAPRGPNGHFGGPVSAPVFRRVAEAAIRYLGISPSLNPSAPVLVARHEGENGPFATAVTDDGSVVSLITTEPGTVPDVFGMSARDAMQRLVKAGLTARISGDGFVKAQNPAAGAPLEDGGICELILERASARRSAPPTQP